MKNQFKKIAFIVAVFSQVVCCSLAITANDAVFTQEPQAAVQEMASESQYTGLRQDEDGVWRYYSNGVFDSTKTGVVMYGDAWFYVTNGVLDPSFVGLVPYNGGVFYVNAGQVRTDITGLVISTDGNWYYLSSGQVRTDVDGLVMDNDGQWYYVNAGRVRTDITGLVQNVDGKWYYLSSGRVRTDHSGRVWYNNNCYIIKNGVLDTSANGIIFDDGYYYYASYGQIQLGITGLVQNVDGQWYYVSSGQVRRDYNGLTLYNNHWFVIKAGKLHTGFNGLYSYNEQLFLVNDGTMRTDYTGYYKLDGITYYIVSGQIYSSDTVLNFGSVAKNTCPICGDPLRNGQIDIHTFTGSGYQVYNVPTDSVYVECNICKQAWPINKFADTFDFSFNHAIQCNNEYNKSYISCRYCKRDFEEGTEPEIMKESGGYCSKECMIDSGAFCPVCLKGLYIDGCHNCGYKPPEKDSDVQ